MACIKECFEAIISTCSSDILLKAGLTAATEYFWVLTDRHGNITQRRATTDVDGMLTITLPESMALNQYSGMINLSIRSGDDYLVVVPMIFAGIEYNCVLIELSTIDHLEDDDSEINQIGA